MSGSQVLSSADFNKALEIGRPPNIKKLFPNSNALIVSGKFIDRALLAKGKTITMRPAVPSSDPLGPVIWVCGDRDPSSGWTVHGVDRTDVDKSFIHSSWR